MRRSLFITMAASGLCLVLVWSAFSAPNGGPPRPTRASIPIQRGPYAAGIGPAFGGNVSFVGLTTHTFPMGAGALAVSRECNAEFPESRLCEWREIYAAVPPVDEFPTEVLVAPNYETNPVPACMTPAGGLRCGPLPLMRPAACCGFPVSSSPPPGLGILVVPGSPQTVNACTDSIEFTVTALDAQNNPLPGLLLQFLFPPVVGGTLTFAGMGVLTPASAVTDANGEVRTTLTFDASRCASLCVGVGDCSGSFVVEDQSGQVVGGPISVLDNIP